MTGFWRCNGCWRRHDDDTPLCQHCEVLGPEHDTRQAFVVYVKRERAIREALRGLSA